MSYQIGDTVAAFTLPRVEGGDLTVNPATSGATAVVFISNRCPYAVAWHERIQQVARDYADRGVTLVQINANRTSDRPHESAEACAERVAAGELASPYLRDETQELTRTFGAEKTPDVFVTDGAGALVYRGAPDADYEDPSQAAAYLRAALDSVLAGKPVETPETTPLGCTIKWLTEDPTLLANPTVR